MKAVVMQDYGGPEQLAIGEVADPEPGAGDVVVDIAAASLNPIDWKMRAGHVRKFFEFDLPHVLGRDFSGIVRSVGAGVDGISVGDAVFGIAEVARWGSHAEAIAVKAGLVAAKPEALSHEAAAALGISGITVLAALEETAPIGAGDRILIHAGAGGVGHLAIQYAKHKGAQVLTTARATNHDFVAALGADEAIDYTAADFTEAAAGCDVVFDTMGGDVHRRSFDALKPGGLLVYINAEPLPESPGRPDVTVLNAQVRGDRAGLERIVALVGEGTFKPAVEQTYALEDFAEAYARIETGHSRGKIVFKNG
ncbi:MAG TPA: NADP-dependent oxidoreductase [Alphaproteobacteria bacterium]|nr:NADP-dependent oxidoreductase [Alphaproteobacteria bacterium]